ncbi:MAG: hypothetical protein AAF411_15970 [Myxococcota bacterium]
MRRLSPRLLFAFALVVSACGGAPYDGARYDDGRVRFSIAAPPAPWSRVSVDDEANLAWTHRDLAAVVHAHGSCSPSLDIPLQSLTNHLLVGFRNREIVQQRRRPFLQREALDTHVLASLDGVMRELRFVVFKKDECVYDLSVLSRPGESFATASAFFDSWIADFSVD